jgi:hypothetical protein
MVEIGSRKTNLFLRLGHTSKLSVLVQLPSSLDGQSDGVTVQTLKVLPCLHVSAATTQGDIL